MNFCKSKFLLSFLFIFSITAGVFAQENRNWQNLDYAKDSVMGVSVEKAYAELLKGKKSEPVIVAVLDGGVEISHKDLKRVIYKSKKEKLNGKDDDHNGYIDDVNGWNFLGNATQDVDFETLELVRQIRKLKRKFAESNLDSAEKVSNPEYKKLLLMQDDYIKQYETANRTFIGVAGFKKTLDQMESKMNKDSLNISGFTKYKTTDPAEAFTRKAVLETLEDESIDYSTFKANEIDKAYNYYYEKLNYHLNLNYSPRTALGINDNTAFYGNNHVTGPDALHGTHVAGIIAADRKNRIGINGVANNVKILGVRMVPNGDERDKDVANAIRYAVDQGAKVINMSFGKSYSDDKKIVDDAVKYAVSKDVLLVHAAGNDNKNLDIDNNFPNRNYEGNSGIASSWLEVGASGPKNNESLKASFSNYGKTTVDVFAPGVEIYSTVPGSKYESLNGTSMASPVVSGIAALIRSYYPSLTATQVKKIIMDSSVKINHSVDLMVDNKAAQINFSDLSISGGVVNAYNAIKMAASLVNGTVANYQ
ncbi:S8 family peptidase [Pedobacter arcticus]|uniref:S8 family peptidase n=1 Tax=Pedobacter arcticus TaxID=752140 RepID=UPI000302A2BC|nr:S8 family peptidase [Pedobacter arcticus]